MGTEVVVSDDGDQGAAASTEFAAGVAAATAVQAEQQASEAGAQAEAAAGAADAALDVAYTASEEAWNARAAVEELRDEVRNGFAAVGEALSSIVSAGPPAQGEPEAPAPEAREKPADGAGEAESGDGSGEAPKRRRDLWFGDR
jgi:hypothetical protein